MASISKKIQQWHHAGLITAEQQLALNRYEEEHNPPRNWWATVVLLGVAIMSLGCISLIAANWIAIPAGVKLGVAFALLIGLALLTWWLDSKQSPIWFETALSGFLIGCLAMLGLLAQIFQVGGQWYHGLLAWGLCTLPLVLFARRLLSRFLWVTLTLTGLTITLLALPSYDVPDGAWLHVLPLLGFLVAILAYQGTELLTPFQHLRSSCFFWGQFSSIIALGLVDLFRSIGEYDDISLNWYYSSWVLALLMAISVLTNPYYKALNRILLLAAVALLMVYYHPTGLFTGATTSGYWFSDTAVSIWQADDVRAPILTLIILTLYAIHVGNLGMTTLFNLTTLLIGMRFLILYFQALGGLAATGFGLIISGALIMSLGWAWQRYRTHLQQWTQGLDN